MADPVSNYRNVCRNAEVLVGGNPARECSRAAISMVQDATDGLRQGRMDEAGARRVLAEGHAAYAHTPLALQASLGAKLSELDARIGELAAARSGRQDQVAPTARPTARAASPTANLTAGIRPELAHLRGSDLRSQIQESLFADRAQTTRTLGALASMSPSALRELVTARVGAEHAGVVLEALADNAQMQVRVRVSERAGASLARGAERLEQRSTGDGLQATLAQLRGPRREPVLAMLGALGADTDELRSLIVRQNEPEARHELTLMVADTMSGGATQMRELAQRYDAAHNVLDGSGELYTLFPESVRQVSAQLGVPADASRSALGAMVQQDVADAARNASINKWIGIAAMATSAILTGGLGGGLIASLGTAGIRAGAIVGIAYEHAGDMSTAAAAGEADAESAEAAWKEAHIGLSVAIGSAVVGGATELGLEHLRHTAANAREVAGVVGAVVETVSHPVLHGPAGRVFHH